MVSNNVTAFIRELNSLSSIAKALIKVNKPLTKDVETTENKCPPHFVVLNFGYQLAKEKSFSAH